MAKAKTTKTTTAKKSFAETVNLENEKESPIETPVQKVAEATISRPVRTAEVRQGRKVKGSETVWHDLFELKTAKMQKNVAFDAKFPEYVPVDHQHFYHTVDSNGKQLTISSVIGGHFHVMEVEFPKENNGEPKIISVSGPMKWAKKQIAANRFKTIAVPVNEYDTHTHETEYRFSEEVKIRSISPDAVNIHTYEQNKLAAPAGISG